MQVFQEAHGSASVPKGAPPRSSIHPAPRPARNKFSAERTAGTMPSPASPGIRPRGGPEPGCRENPGRRADTGTRWLPGNTQAIETLFARLPGQFLKFHQTNGSPHETILSLHDPWRALSCAQFCGGPHPTTPTTVAPCSSGHGVGVACGQRRVASQVDRQTFATQRRPIKLELALAVQFQTWANPDRCQRLASYAAKARAIAQNVTLTSVLELAGRNIADVGLGDDKGRFAQC